MADAITVERYEWAGDLAARDLARLAEIHNAVWREWVPSERPMSGAAYADSERLTAHPERIVRTLARDGGGEVVAQGQIQWRDEPGASGCMARLLVHPGARRAGVGRVLGDALVQAARDEARIAVTFQTAVDSPPDRACRASGLREDMTTEHNRVDPRTIPLDLLEAWRRAGEAASGYSLVTYDDRCPDDALAAGFVHARMALNDAPLLVGEPEADHTVEELRAVEEAAAAASYEWWNVGVRHDVSGEIVGLSEVLLPRARPWLATQGDTGVVAAHRGHRLGAWMKAVNHLRLLRERSEVEVVTTWNAAANEPMLRINRALGFEPVQRFRAWYLDLT